MKHQYSHNIFKLFQVFQINSLTTFSYFILRLLSRLFQNFLIFFELLFILDSVRALLSHLTSSSWCLYFQIDLLPGGLLGIFGPIHPLIPHFWCLILFLLLFPLVHLFLRFFIRLPNIWFTLHLFLIFQFLIKLIFFILITFYSLLFVYFLLFVMGLRFLARWLLHKELVLIIIKGLSRFFLSCILFVIFWRPLFLYRLLLGNLFLSMGLLGEQRRIRLVMAGAGEECVDVHYVFQESPLGLRLTLGLYSQLVFELQQLKVFAQLAQGCGLDDAKRWNCFSH